MYIDLVSGLSCLFTSNSESELEREKIFFVLRLGLSSSVLGGVSGSRPVLGTFMLPLGFLVDLTKEPLILGRGRGEGGPWILVISLMRVLRLGVCVKRREISR